MDRKGGENRDSPRQSGASLPRRQRQRTDPHDDMASQSCFLYTAGPHLLGVGEGVCVAIISKSPVCILHAAVMFISWTWIWIFMDF